MNNINYIYDNEDNILKKEIINKIISFNPSINRMYHNGLYYLLIYCKHIIEKNNLDIQKIKNDNIEELLPYLNKFDSHQYILQKSVFIKYKVYTLIKYVLFRDYYIEIYNDRVIDAYIDKNKRYLFLSNASIPYINYPNVDIYYNKNINLLIYNIYDEILGNNRKYYNDLKNIDFSKYDSIIFINDKKEPYESIKEYKKIFNECNVLLKCKYSDISKYKIKFDDFVYNDQTSNINSILLDKSLAYIIYSNTRNTKINIKELSNIEDKDLSNIINTNKCIDNVSINVNVDDIINNRYRIGFSYYNNDNIGDNTTKDILKLVDYNKYLTNRLEELDNKISNKLDEMFIK